ncbi:triose-phosphate isomerase [Sandaracinus amylolyticus]|uniref:triose-phosphate isomerase n=1 Tax=Sandaracinus amylolyticus TaxID=927083 RepID=UPI001F01C4B5|nr:triose-phosphate isomerase [Sandaracinus amylolyticus]UJR80567.1 Triose-phosphate isomerase [Sandaracinus amylolyticus]
MSARKKLVAGNWKLHHDRAASVELAKAIAAGLPSSQVEVVIAPVFTSLDVVRGAIAGTPIGLSAQNLHWDDSGAFTGEVSAPLLKDVGCTHVIIGHSERRQLFGETDDRVSKRLGAALKHGLVPIVCVGETLEEREAGRTLDVVLGQIDAALAGITKDALAGIVIAYEPVWAIGTGKVAKSSDAQEVQAAIRARMSERIDAGAAQKTRILYGGSVKPDNAAELMAQPDVDGALVGGASLKADSFLAIVKGALPAS